MCGDGFSYLSPTACKGCPSLNFKQCLLPFVFLVTATSNRCGVVAHCGFMHFSLTISDARHFFKTAWLLAVFEEWLPCSLPFLSKAFVSCRAAPCAMCSVQATVCSVRRHFTLCRSLCCGSTVRWCDSICMLLLFVMCSQDHIQSYCLDCSRSLFPCSLLVF